MASNSKKRKANSLSPKDEGPPILRGWRQISDFLGEPTNVVQRWRSEGMPLRKEGRFVTTTPDELNAWLGKESGKPVHVVAPESDLAAELRRGLAMIKQQKPAKKNSKKR